MNAIFKTFSDRAGRAPALRTPLAALLLPSLSVMLLVGCTSKSAIPETAPVISTFSPTQGVVGTSINITGSGLLDTTAGTIGGIAIANALVSSDTALAVTVPPAAVTGLITVTSQLGTATSLTNFTVIPQITSISPTSGPVGTVVTLTGTGFTTVSYVSFGSETQPTGSAFTADTPQQVTATVASDATTGPVLITASGLSSQLGVTDTTPSPIFTVTQ